MNPDPMYKQVTDQVKDAIARGALTPDTRLPSIRLLSKELNISPITIKRAYADLEKDGFIYTRPGMGSFVAGINKEKMRMEKLEEIRLAVTKLIASGEKFGISPQDIINIIKNGPGDQGSH